MTVALGAVTPLCGRVCLEPYRLELTAFCRRMLGSSDAEDAVQETFLRAWRGLERFEGRAPLRSWLYRIARNVCLDVLEERRRRARPIDLDSPSVGAALDPRAEESAEEVVLARESVRVALLAAVRRLPPRQRAVLILREVLRWRASEVATLLGTSVPSVNSALQRARERLRESDARATAALPPDGPRQEAEAAHAQPYSASRSSLPTTQKPGVGGRRTSSR